MPQVTKITPQKKKKDRSSIFIDGRFAFGIKEEIAVEFGLKTGKEISENEIAGILKREEGAKLMDKALNFLSFRQRSEKEVEDYLAKKIKAQNDIDYNQAKESMVIGEIIAKLKKYKYLDDLAFAKEWVASRSRSRPKGKLVLKWELIKKGIEKSIIDQVLESAGDEETLAKKSLEKKISRFKKLPQDEFKKKIFAHLISRGFSFETAKKVFAFYTNKS